jgi:hypothetical protein
MPITIDTPFDVPVSQPVTVKANRLHLDQLVIDATNRDQPIASLLLVPYLDDGKQQQYSTQQLSVSTRDLYKVAALIPEVGIAMAAVFAAVQAWMDFRTQRQIEYNKAVVARDAKPSDASLQVAVDAAAAALDDPANYVPKG